ncbi:MAG: copper resistance protein CopC, partial [Actinobacteria bacterium]|nr:copper resistance protein CopC [Actinomycetota bacterium]
MSRHVARVLIVLVAIFVAPSMASAHAGLESSDPSPGAYLDVSPERITLTFDEAVTTAFGSLRVLDTNAAVVVETPLKRGEEKSIAVAEVGQTLDDGTYVVVWRVTSSDGHPVQGSFTFVVREATSTV